MDSSSNLVKLFISQKKFFDIILVILILILCATSISLFFLRNHKIPLLQPKFTAFTIHDFSQADILAKDTSGARIKEILVSDAADKNGDVTLRKKFLSRKSSTIYTTIQMNAPHSIGVAKAIMILPNGETMGPVFSEINTPGNVMQSFAFMRASPEWQPGRYVIVVRLSSGDTETIHALIK